MNVKTRYAKNGDIHIAYQVFGDGPIDLVFVPGFVSHIENYWDEPSVARCLRRMGSFARVIMFDKRGTGLSDRVDELPGLDDRMDDVRSVMDTVGIEKAAVFGISEGGSLASLFSATYPNRCKALILYGAFSNFSAWISDPAEMDAMVAYVESDWGSGESLPGFAPSMADDAAFKTWWGKFERLGASPRDVIKLMRMNSQIDITGILPSIQAETLVIHRKEDILIDFAAGELLAERIPNARLLALPGQDHLPWVGENTDLIYSGMEEFLTGTKGEDQTDRVLATVLFTDIVSSTAKAEELGDQRWQDLLQAHNKIAEQIFARYRSMLVESTGDGFMATFDGPARAVRCAREIQDAVKPLGIQTRMGLHIGEIEQRPDKIFGIAVHIAARISAIANTNEILVSRTIKDLLAGSGIRLSERGLQNFKGVSDPMEVFSVIH